MPFYISFGIVFKINDFENKNKRKKFAIKSEFQQNNPRITAVWLDWGFRLNLKLVLYLEILRLTEK